MKRKKVLITGGSGFLGQYLNIELAKDFDIFTLFNKNPGNCMEFHSAIVDLRNFKALEKIFAKFSPDVVVHTACYSNPDICSKLPEEEVINLNVNITEDIAYLCKGINATMIFTSTDLIYKSSNELKKEDSPLEPKSLYAETKISAEEKIKISGTDYIILRTSLLYGLGLSHSASHFENMLNSLRNDEPVNLFHDQYRTPLEVSEAAQIISDLIKKDIKNEIINIGGKDKISRYEMGELACEIFELDKKNLIKKDGEEILGKIFVKDVSFDTTKFKSLDIGLRSVKENLEEIKKRESEAELSLEDEDFESEE